MEGWLTQNVVGQIWWVLLLMAANAGGFIMYVKISVKGLSDKVKAVEDGFDEIKDDVESELKELRRNIEQEIKEIRINASSSADKIVEGFRNALYSKQDGQSIYMPRVSCRLQSEKCQMHITEVYNTKVDAIDKKIEGICQIVKYIQREIISQKKDRE
jgi:hypothetical protein